MLQRRDRLLEATAKATNVLLTLEDFDEAVNTALKIIVEGAGCDRINVLEGNFEASSEPTLTVPTYHTVIYEWARPGMIRQMAHLEAGRIPSAGIEVFLEQHYLNGDGFGGFLEDWDEPLRSAYADDHPIVRQGLVAILNDQPDMNVVSEVDNGQQAIVQYRLHQPDVSILDLNMSEVGGVEAIATIRAEFPHAAIIMFSIYETDEDIYQGLRAGAKAYLLKDMPCLEILEVIRSVSGRQRFNPCCCQRSPTVMPRHGRKPQKIFSAQYCRVAKTTKAQAHRGGKSRRLLHRQEGLLTAHPSSHLP